MDRKQHASIFSRARTRGAVLALIAVLAIAGPNAAALAQSGAGVTGTMDATAEGNIPKGAAIHVRASSGAPEARAIADLFRDALEGAGYRVSGNDDLGKGHILNFQFSGQSPSSGGRSRLELRGDSSSGRSGDVDLTMRWKARPDKVSPAVRRDRQFSVVIEDNARNPLWRARIYLRANEADDIALADAVMPALIANLGRTVYALRVP